MRSTEQERKRLEQLKLLLSSLSTCETIGELAEKTGIPQSTIQRRLNDREFITKLVDENNLDIPAETICANIVAWLYRAKCKGHSQGGIRSQQEHGYGQNDSGQFTCSRRKPR